MNQRSLSEAQARNREAIRAFEQKSGVVLSECYQCGKCSAGCPMAEYMDLMPRQVIRCLQLGLLEDALRSSSPWICASCNTCSARCPHDVEIADLMKAVRQEADRRKIRPVRTVSLFTKLFLLPVRWFGRSHELTLTAFYNIGSGHILQNFIHVPKMLTGRKLVFLPARIKGGKNMRRLMENCEREAEQR